MKWTPWIKVVETNTVPKTRIAGGMFLRIEPEEKEPIGQRIIEAPDDTERTETLRDPHSGFTAFVPVGSVKKGETLVTSGGGGKTTACAVCHGADLRGLGPVPGIAGRSPSYMVRQLYDMQAGHPQRRVVGSDEAGGREVDQRGHARDRGVHGFEVKRQRQKAKTWRVAASTVASLRVREAPIPIPLLSYFLSPTSLPLTFRRRRHLAGRRLQALPDRRPLRPARR